MRYLSLHLPFLATDRIRRRSAAGRSAPRDADAAPLAVSALATVAKVKSAFRLVALDPGARALGLKPMTALADARAMHPGLDVHDADPDGDLACRDALVDWCRLFTPLAAPDGDDGIVLDVTGAAHLHGGEMALMATMVRRLATQGFAAGAAIAASPGAAWALARHGGGHRLRLPDDLDLTAAQRIFAPMPLAALRLDEAAVARLGQAGLRRVGDLLLRPRAPIAARFGRDIHRRLDALFGLAAEPISPRFEAPAFVAERRFAEGIARREDVEGTILSLAYDLCGLLARHGEGARRLDVALYRVDGLVRHLEAGTSRPLRDPIAMARLFRERIEAAGEDGLDTGYGFEMVRLAATAAERLDESQPGWDVAGAGEADVADLVDRLGARFGLERVTRLSLAESHQPERAAVAVSAAKPAAKTPARGGATIASVVAEPGDAATLPERPIRLFERPEPIETMAEVPDGPPLRFRWRRMLHQVAAIEGPERIGPEWWKEGAGGTRDYFRAEDTGGRRFWLYREGLYREAAEPRWYVHGIFA